MLTDRIGLDDNQWHTVASVLVPAGAYAIAGKGFIRVPEQDNPSGAADCQLLGGATILDEETVSGQGFDDPFWPAELDLSLLGTTSVGGQSVLSIRCSSLADGVGAYAFKILATKVGAIH